MPDLCCNILKILKFGAPTIACMTMVGTIIFAKTFIPFNSITKYIRWSATSRIFWNSEHRRYPLHKTYVIPKKDREKWWMINPSEVPDDTVITIKDDEDATEFAYQVGNRFHDKTLKNPFKKQDDPYEEYEIKLIIELDEPGINMKNGRKAKGFPLKLSRRSKYVYVSPLQTIYDHNATHQVLI